MILKRAIAEASKIIIVYSLSLWLPVIVAVLNSSWGSAWVFVQSALLVQVWALFFFFKRKCLPSGQLDAAASFLILVFVWLGIVLLSALPWVLYFSVSWPVSIFEATSALTTSGVEVIGDPAQWPAAFLWYRQQLSWIGGAGVVVLSLGLLSIYQNSLYANYLTDYGLEMRGLGFAQRVAKTAGQASLVYLAITMTAVLSYYLSGLSLWEAALEAMTIVSTAGFSLVDQEPTLYASSIRKCIAIIFMGASSVGLHVYILLVRRQWSSITNGETRFFFIWLVGAVLMMMLFEQQETILVSLFTMLSFVSTTGLVGVENYDQAFVLIMVLSGLVGGCMGSTAGGIKIHRLRVMAQSLRAFIEQAWRPARLLPYQDQGAANLISVQSYIILFCLTMLFGVWFLLLTGLDFNDAVMAIISAITNVGSFASPALFIRLSDVQYLIMTGVMLIGRVELIAILVLCLPHYWRQI